MDLCPHCGEPLVEFASVCPHCGSDWETGWSPDADLYSFELPDDEAAESDVRYASHAATTHFEEFVWGAFVILAAVVFAWAAYETHGAAVSASATVVLALSFLAFHRWLHRA